MCVWVCVWLVGGGHSDGGGIFDGVFPESRDVQPVDIRRSAILVRTLSLHGSSSSSSDALSFVAFMGAFMTFMAFIAFIAFMGGRLCLHGLHGALLAFITCIAAAIALIGLKT